MRARSQFASVIPPRGTRLHKANMADGPSIQSAYTQSLPAHRLDTEFRLIKLACLERTTAFSAVPNEVSRVEIGFQQTALDRFAFREPSSPPDTADVRPAESI
jgi:hypothetical protein